MRPVCSWLKRREMRSAEAAPECRAYLLPHIFVIDFPLGENIHAVAAAPRLPQLAHVALFGRVGDEIKVIFLLL